MVVMLALNLGFSIVGVSFKCSEQNITEAVVHYRKRNFVAFGENAADRQIFKVIKIRRLRMLERSIAQS